MEQVLGNNFQQGGGSGGGRTRTNPIRPLTIKQLKEANSVGEGVMVIDGHEVTQATIVGRVVGYENANMGSGGAQTAKHFGYRITDNTGMVVARQWLDGNSDSEPLPINSHVRASGSVKVWQNAPVVTGTVVAVADSNELNYHMLDAVLTHLRLTRGNRRPSEAKAAATVASMHNSAGAVGAHNVLPGGNEQVPLTDLLVNMIRQNGQANDSGMSMDELVAGAQRYNFTSKDVGSALRVLASEGKVYQMHDNRFNI